MRNGKESRYLEISDYLEGTTMCVSSEGVVDYCQHDPRDIDGIQQIGSTARGVYY